VPLGARQQHRCPFDACQAAQDELTVRAGPSRFRADRITPGTYWRALETGRSDHPVMRAYLSTARAYGIPGEVMTPYFRAMREDLTITRFPSFADLHHYTEGSALVVGRAMTYILGVQPPHTIADALPHADSLSIAMQLSNF
jgi:phytoene/squalene synthetase